MTRVAIIGATGYTALELLKILLRHPHADVTALTSRSETGHVGAVHPSLVGRLDLHLENLNADQIAERADVAFCCLPHVASMEMVPSLLEAGLKVVDLSADYRLRDPDIYQQWYGHAHSDTGRLATSVYGLPEIFGDKISGQQLVANPGCYTSTAILALAPLLANKMIRPQGIIINGMSGVSGAGRTPKLGTLFSECNESVQSYSVGNHRHTPEIEQALGDVAGERVEVIFTPHLIPMDRGIHATIYAEPLREVEQTKVLNLIRGYYAGRPFVRVVEHLPRTKDVAGTNYFDVTARVVSGKILLLATLDNLIKGASGVAVQNFNLMCGYPEETGLVV